MKRPAKTVKSLSARVREIQTSSKSPKNCADAICAEVFAAFEAATQPKSKPNRNVTTAGNPVKAPPKMSPIKGPKKTVIKASRPSIWEVKKCCPARGTDPLLRAAKVSPFLGLIRSRLTELRDDLLDEMAGVKRPAVQIPQNPTDANADNYDKDFARFILNQENDPLLEIEQALKRLDCGTFGLCEKCLKPIPAARLERLPFVRDDVECQAKPNVQLHPYTEKCLKSAEWIVQSLATNPCPDFEWSCAIVPLCKGFEYELVKRVFEPLKQRGTPQDFQPDVEDKDIGKIAKFCIGKGKPPELGVAAWFIRTAATSKTRRETSVLLRTFIALVTAMADPEWITEPKSLLHAIEELTSKYRNPSSHTGEMGEAEYRACRELLSAPETGALWKLASATVLKTQNRND